MTAIAIFILIPPLIARQEAASSYHATLVMLLSSDVV